MPPIEFTSKLYHAPLTPIAPILDHRLQRCIGCRFGFNRWGPIRKSLKAREVEWNEAGDARSFRGEQ
jgi:hypothetical protein